MVTTQIDIEQLDENHKTLVEKARKWLFYRCPVVLTELCSSGGESPDAIGFKSGHSILIECKVSKSDYYRDKNKHFRRSPQYGMGKYRYFLAPIGMINPEKLPNNWGLLEPSSRGVKIIKEALPFLEYNFQGEQQILISTIKRIGQTLPIGVYCRTYYGETPPTVSSNTQTTVSVNTKLDRIEQQGGK